jgi:hypothetical protein
VRRGHPRRPPSQLGGGLQAQRLRCPRVDRTSPATWPQRWAGAARRGQVQWPLGAVRKRIESSRTATAPHPPPARH